MSTNLDATAALRHALDRMGLVSVVHGYHSLRGNGRTVARLLEPDRARRFAAIYDNAVWRPDADGWSLPGWGSDLAPTLSVRGRLPEILDRLGTGTLLDLGCGDFGWMSEVDLDVDYVGVDIVDRVIEENTRRHGSPRRKFLVRDGVTDPLPAADTVLCRAVLSHLSFADIFGLLGNVRACGATYLLATTDDRLRFNADIISGDHRRLNMRESPFDFPLPNLVIPDERDDGTARTLAAWAVADLPLR